MTDRRSDLVMDMAIKIAVIVCLSTLALGLISGADPLAALLRSSIAFISFATLGWAASMLFNAQLVQQPETEAVLDEPAQEEPEMPESNALSDAETPAV